MVYLLFLFSSLDSHRSPSSPPVQRMTVRMRMMLVQYHPTANKIPLTWILTILQHPPKGLLLRALFLLGKVLQRLPPRASESCLFVVFLQIHRYPSALSSLCYCANRYNIDNLSQPSTIWSLETLIGSIYTDHAATHNSQRSLFCRYNKKP